MGGAGAAVLRDQQIGFGVGLGQLLIEIAQGRLQVLDLGFLVFELLREVRAERKSWRWWRACWPLFFLSLRL